MRTRSRPSKYSDYVVNYTTNDATLFEFLSVDMESFRAGADNKWYPHSSAICKAALKKSGRIEIISGPYMYIHYDVILKSYEKLHGPTSSCAHLLKVTQAHAENAKVCAFEDFLSLIKNETIVGFNVHADVSVITNACALLGLTFTPKNLIDLRDLVAVHNNVFLDFFPPGKMIPAPGPYASLQELIRFVRDDLKFVQKHWGSEDVLLNIELMEFMTRTLSCNIPTSSPATFQNHNNRPCQKV